MANIIPSESTLPTQEDSLNFVPYTPSTQKAEVNITYSPNSSADNPVASEQNYREIINGLNDYSAALNRAPAATNGTTDDLKSVLNEINNILEQYHNGRPAQLDMSAQFLDKHPDAALKISKSDFSIKAYIMAGFLPIIQHLAKMEKELDDGIAATNAGIEKWQRFIADHQAKTEQPDHP